MIFASWMTILSALSQLDFVTVIVCHCVFVAISFPAYKRTKNLGFLLWSIGACIGLWNSVSMHTIGADIRGNPQGYHFVRYSYRILFVVASMTELAGTIMVIRGYLKLFRAQVATPEK